jgi:hypothetical protein
MLHVHALSLLISTAAAMVLGAAGGAYGAVRFFRWHIGSSKNARALIRRLHAAAHREAMACVCCDTLQIDEEQARRELVRKGVQLERFLERARARRERHFEKTQSPRPHNA